MSRSADQVLAEMLALLPSGWAWPRDDRSLLAAVLRPMATGIAEVEAAAEAMMAEVDPRTAQAALVDFERLLGADPCGRDLTALPLPERRRVAHARYTARGGASRSYFAQLAADYGTPITITELVPSQIGRSAISDELVTGSEAFTWVVTLPLGEWTVAKVGESAVGDRLYDFKLSDLECEIGRRKPAHTDALFYYEEVPL